jgi:hypothetical protein
MGCEQPDHRPLCPTEAQVVAWLDRYATSELRRLSRWNGCTLFENVEIAVTLQGRFSWRELFDEPEYALAQAFDDWRMDFDDLEIDE